MTKVYAVIGGYGAYGGEIDSLRLFDCKSTADAYRKQLIEDYGYDWAQMAVREVNMESAIATT